MSVVLGVQSASRSNVKKNNVYDKETNWKNRKVNNGKENQDRSGNYKHKKKYRQKNAENIPPHVNNFNRTNGASSTNKYHSQSSTQKRNAKQYNSGFKRKSKQSQATHNVHFPVNMSYPHPELRHQPFYFGQVNYGHVPNDNSLLFILDDVRRVQYPFSDVHYPIVADLELDAKLQKIYEETEKSLLESALKVKGQVNTARS